jgi:hypothetical protein
MNYSLPIPEPMTDLARSITGPQGGQYLNYLMRALYDEEKKLARLMSGGMSVNEYAIAQRRTKALQHAQAALKSIGIFLKT